MRERELKLVDDGVSRADKPSLPMRERELKLDIKSSRLRSLRSLPMRERELKLDLKGLTKAVNGRSPCGSVN